MIQPLRQLTTTTVGAVTIPVRLAARLVGEQPTPAPTAGDGGAGDGPAPAGAGGAADHDPDSALASEDVEAGLGALLGLFDDGAELFEDVVEESVDLIEDSLGFHRRIWEDDDHDHAQIEVRGIDDPAAVGMRQRLAQSLAKVDQVRWAEVNAITSRVAVAFDGGESTLSGLVELIESIEESVGTPRRAARRAGWDVENRAEHPADVEPVHRTIAIIAGDVASLGWTAIGRATRMPRLPVEATGLISVIDNNPWLRLHAQRLLGRRTAALALPLASAVASGVSQGPFGTLVDLGVQVANLGELRARVDAWARREPEFYAVHSDDPIDPPRLDPRPVPLADGPIEAWSGWATGLGLGVAGVTLAATRDLRLSTDALLASTPKAARLGREAFAAVLGRTLAMRGVVPLDGSALRRLDRIDTVVLDADVLVAAEPTIRAAVTPAGEEADARTISVAERLFDPTDPQAAQRGDRWRLLPVEDVDADARRRARGATARAREIAAGGGVALAVLRDDEVVALLDVAHEVDAGVEPVVAAIRTAGLHLAVADRRGRVARMLDADQRVRTGEALGDDVRAMQADGRGVMVIGRQGHRGLAAADVGVAIAAPTGRPSWGADLILGRELADAATIVRACTVARDVSERSAKFAAAGTGLAGLVIVTGPRRGAGGRALAVLNGAAGAAVISGMWEAVQLSHEARPRRPDRSRWHTLPADRVIAQLDTDAQRGLSSVEVAPRRSAAAVAGDEVSPLEPFLAELANPLNPVLGVGAALSAASGSMADASLVLGLIGVNTVVGGVQRLRADRAVRSMLVGTVEDVTVVRDGAPHRIPGDALVRGDVIVLTAGEPVPADARIIEADGCEVDESTLTGESLPVRKVADAVPAEEDLAERSCMLYEDTTVVAGSVRAVVVATGHATQVARSLALSGPPPRTGVELRLEELTRRLLPGALAVAGATGGIGLLRRWPLTEVTGTAVSLAIASVPEGLPFVATAGQLAGARRLAASGAVVRNPRTVEALGRVDVLCVDKTGTLTEGRVAVRGLTDGRERHLLDELDDVTREVLATAVLASDQPGDDGRALQDLDDADRALHDAAGQLGLDPAALVGGFALLDDLPFEASRGVHAVLGAAGGNRRRTLLVKGAPETLLDACTTWRVDGASVAIDDDTRAELDAHVDGQARRGHRLLAVARGSAPGRDGVEEDDLEELELLGFVVLADPVRPTAAEAVRGIAAAGVRTVMITGDHPETAATIAEQLDLAVGSVLVGADLDALDDEALADRLETTSVVARVTPAHKQRIVQVLQDHDHVVAMTGDGANDAAAIRLAQVGVALGTRSAAAAREAADIVVVDDRVETLIDAIAEGRALWGSIREALAVLVGGNLGEIGFTAIASAFSSGAPLHPRQFLLVNLFTDLAPAVAIAVRPPDDVSSATLLREGPDRSLGSSLRRDIAVRGTATALGATGAYAVARLTGTPGRASTVGLAALVGTQLGQTLLAGGWRRPSTVLTVAGSAAVFVGVVQTPGVSHFFGSRPLGPLGWSQALTASAVATVGSEVASHLADRLDELAAADHDHELAGVVPRRRAPVVELTERPTRVAVTGADGRLARDLIARLHADGHHVVAFGTDPRPRPQGERIEVVRGRPEDAEAVQRATADRAVVYHLGSALQTGNHRLTEREEAIATAVARGADLAGAARIVHLGALLDDEQLHRAPEHVFARHAAAAVLRAGPVPVSEVRTGVVLGHRDRTFRLLRAVARTPLDLRHPALDRRTQPVAVDDLTAVLARLADGTQHLDRVLEIGGPDTVTYRELVELVRSREGLARMLRPPTGRFPLELAAPLLARIARLEVGVTAAMLRVAERDSVVGDAHASRRFGALLRTSPQDALAPLWTPAEAS